MAGDVLRFVSSMLRPHVQLAAENLYLRKQLALYLEPGDPATLLASVATLAFVSALAGWLPANRASRLDPTQVLREI